MNEPVVCPWCQSEIVWDEEIGPESTCPHCDNELSDYRTLKLDVEEVEMPNDHASNEEDMPGGSLLDEDYEDDRYAAYEDGVQRYVEQQDEGFECTNCGEEMVYIGTQKIDENGFVPFIPKALGKPFLKPPFTMAFYVCPSCFELRSMLSEEDRMALIASHL